MEARGIENSAGVVQGEPWNQLKGLSKAGWGVGESTKMQPFEAPGRCVAPLAGPEIRAFDDTLSDTSSCFPRHWFVLSPTLVRAFYDRSLSSALVSYSLPVDRPGCVLGKENTMTEGSAAQGDLFTFDSPLMSGIQGERSLMAFPFFSLGKNAWTKPFFYKTDQVTIEVGPGPKGIATIYDKEILLYIASLMVAKLEAGLPVEQDFYFTANDLFRVTGVNTSARSYSRLFEALERLQGTQIKTNIEAGGEGEDGFFSWLESARLFYSKKGTGERRLKGIRVRLCDWLFRSILRDHRVLEYTPAYFQLGPVGRRLYEVARAACLNGSYSTSLEDLRLQLGYQSSARHFKVELKKLIENDAIPGFSFAISDTPPSALGRKRTSSSDIVTITPKVVPLGAPKQIVGPTESDSSE